MSQKRVSGFPEKGADLRGGPGKFRRSPGNFRGTSGLLFSSTVRGLPGKSPKTSGEVRETSGEVRGLSRSSGEPDSLPVTRQICLQTLVDVSDIFYFFCSGRGKGVRSATEGVRGVVVY